MTERIKTHSIFGYDQLIKEGTDIVGLAGERVPELRKGMKVIMKGDSQGYVPSGHKEGVEATIVEFTEPFKDGETDHIIKVSSRTVEGWVKPINIILQRKVSLSVRTVRESLADKKVSALQVITEILKLHGEYTNYKLSLDREIDQGEKKNINDWISEAGSFIKDEQMLDGRLFIICLGLIDSNEDVRTSFLYNKGVLQELVHGLRTQSNIVIENSLSEQGRGKWLEYFIRYYNAPTHSDEPSLIDRLGRAPFAKVLSMKINDYFEQTSQKMGYKSNDAFLIHIYAPWGYGKTTLLNLLKKELLQSNDKKFLIIDFNAWQYQRIQPPWWSLLDIIVTQSIRNESRVGSLRKTRIWFRERFSRKLSGPYRNLLIIAGIISGTIGLFLLAGALYAQVIGVITVIGSVIGIIGGFSSSLFPGSSDSARDLLKSGNDPINKLNTYFQKLIKRIENPVVIFVDDLDRCKPDYTVEFLEGIQAIFKHNINIVFVIAADKLWLYESYRKQYRSFGESIGESARPLGYLFLDKIFQISISLPKLSPELQGSYLKYLLAQDEPESVNERLTKEAKDQLSKINSHAGLFKTIKNEQDPIKKRILIEESITKIFSPEMERQTEHYLFRFLKFMESNPRSMTRLVNAYNMWMAKSVVNLNTQTEGIISSDQLARWAIITLRWPYLVDYLEKHVSLTAQLDYMENEILHRGKDISLEEQILRLVDESRKIVKDHQLRNLLFSDPDIFPLLIGEEKMNPIDGNTIKRLLTI
jgi:KAP-like P-loop domain-containing protein